MGDKDLEQHYRRWENWNKQLELQKIKMNSKQEVGKFADNILQKLNKPLNSVIQKSLKNQVQSINSCGICLQTMLKPKQPYSLYPCGHSFCRICLFNGKDAIKVCPYCRQKVEGCALNLSLMKMIVKSEQSTIDNIQPASKTIDEQSIQLLQMKMKLKQLNSQLLIKQKVQQKLLQDKNSVRKQIDKLQQQQKLIQSHLLSNQHDKKILRQLVQTTTQKYLLLQKTHESIRVQRDKERIFKR